MASQSGSVPLSELLRRAMARTRTWTAAAAKVERERTRELARIGSNLNQIARWANTHKGNAEVVEVIAHLVAIERAFDTLASLAPAASSPLCSGCFCVVLLPEACGRIKACSVNENSGRTLAGLAGGFLALWRSTGRAPAWRSE